MLVAYLDGQQPDSGTVGELGFAAGMGLTCIGLRTDARGAGGSDVATLQVEAFVLESGGVIYTSLGDLVAGLRTFVPRLALAS
jgi:nucleoside 2-deoxyribosyltransferase